MAKIDPSNFFKGFFSNLFLKIIRLLSKKILCIIGFSNTPFFLIVCLYRVNVIEIDIIALLYCS